MKTIIPIITASIVCCFSAQAEEAPAPAPAADAAKEQIQQLNKEMNLTADQKAKVKEASIANRDKMTALQQNAEMPQAERQAKAKEYRDANEAAMKAILTPEQFEKWLKIRQITADSKKGTKPQEAK